MTDTTSLNLMTLMDRFPSDDACRELLEDLRWPNGVCCPRCSDTDLCEIPDRNQWQCLGCDYQFSVTAGTIMHDSHLPLRKWFVAIYLLLESRKGMSANQLKRTLGVSYKTYSSRDFWVASVHEGSSPTSKQAASYSLNHLALAPGICHAGSWSFCLSSVRPARPINRLALSRSLASDNTYMSIPIAATIAHRQSPRGNNGSSINDTAAARTIVARLFQNGIRAGYPADSSVSSTQSPNL